MTHALMTQRPDLLVAVAGTGTEVGKTWVACRLAAELRGDGPGGGGAEARPVL